MAAVPPAPPVTRPRPARKCEWCGRPVRDSKRETCPGCGAGLPEVRWTIEGKFPLDDGPATIME